MLCQFLLYSKVSPPHVHMCPLPLGFPSFHWKRWEYQTTWPASWETYMQVRKQQLELDMERQTGSK